MRTDRFFRQAAPPVRSTEATRVGLESTAVSRASGSLAAVDGSEPPAAIDALPALYAGMGYDVVVCQGTVWRSAGALALAAEPSGAIPRSDEADIRAMLRETRRLAAIFCTAHPTGKTVAHFAVAADQTATVQRQFAQHVKRAARQGEVRRLKWHEWHVKALACDRASLGRHGTVNASCLDEEPRRLLAEAAERDPSLVLHGYVTHEGVIAAYLLCRIEDGVCQGLFMHWDDALADFRPTHLLYHEARSALLALPGVDMLRIGRQSIPENDGLDRFKRHAGFAATPCHVGVLVHPFVAPLLERRTTAWLLGLIRRALAPRFPGLAGLEVLECAAPTRRALRKARDLKR